MPDEVVIELDDMDAAPCQWILSFGELRHVGYVQKKTGFIQLIERVHPNDMDKIKKQVEAKLEKSGLPISQPPETPEFMQGE
jgi:hypothetical protein